MRLISFYEIVNILSLFFSMKGLGADWLCQGYAMTKKKTLDWVLETRFIIYIQRLID